MNEDKVSYKLIKEYPNSPKLGTIHSWEGVSNKAWLGTHTYEKYKEYWKEVKEKTYEILALKYNHKLYTLTSQIAENYGGKFKYILSGTDYGFITIQDLEDYPKEVSIESIKRLSDGEVFTIGDRVKCSKNSTIQIVSGLKIVEHRNTIYMTVESSEWGLDFDNIIKVKEPLLVTEDGIEIYDKHTLYWRVDSNFHSWCTDYVKLTKDLKYFSSKEAAEEYILMNKPCLSLKELIELDKNYPYSFMSRLRNLAESRLK